MSEWDHWDPWGHKVEGEQRIWGKGGMLKITKVEPERLRVTYVIDQADGAGLLYIDPKPENTGVWVKWEHTYRCGYDPFQRVSHWLARGEFALELDGGLKKLKLFLEDDKAQGDSLQAWSEYFGFEKLSERFIESY